MEDTRIQYGPKGSDQSLWGTTPYSPEKLAQLLADGYDARLSGKCPLCWGTGKFCLQDCVFCKGKGEL